MYSLVRFVSRPLFRFACAIRLNYVSGRAFNDYYVNEICLVSNEVTKENDSYRVYITVFRMQNVAGTESVT